MAPKRTDAVSQEQARRIEGEIERLQAELRALETEQMRTADDVQQVAATPGVDWNDSRLAEAKAYGPNDRGLTAINRAIVAILDAERRKASAA